MRALTELFTTDVGLMSVAVLAVVLGMAVYYVRYFVKHMHDDEANPPKQP